MVKDWIVWLVFHDETCKHNLIKIVSIEIQDRRCSSELFTYTGSGQCSDRSSESIGCKSSKTIVVLCGCRILIRTDRNQGSEIITAWQRRCGKVMFSVMSFCSLGGWPHVTDNVKGLTYRLNYSIWPPKCHRVFVCFPGKFLGQEMITQYPSLLPLMFNSSLQFNCHLR